MSEIQVTTETAPELLALLQKLATRGPVSITVEGAIGGRPWDGNATFTMLGAEMIACRLGGVTIPIPITPPYFTPSYEGDTVASYRVNKEGNVVYVDYRIFPDGCGSRRFEFPVA